MARSPVLTSSWDARRQEIAYKVAIEGTGKFLLFTEDTLSALATQIEEAMKASRGTVRT